MSKISRILITGATGYLGSQLTSSLVNKGYDITVLIRETSNTKRLQHILHQIEVVYVSDIDTLFNRKSIDLIIHLAANYGRNKENDYTVLDANVSFPLQLLDSAIKARIPFFINTATSLHPFTNSYSLTKYHFHNWLEMHQSSISVYELVLEYFFGPDDEDWKFINMLFNKFRNNEDSISLTSCEQKRYFYYIDDIVEAFELAINTIKQTSKLKSFHVADAHIHELKDVVKACKKIAQNTNTELNFGVIPDREVEANHLLHAIPKANEIGWSPKYSLYEGLLKTWKNLS